MTSYYVWLLPCRQHSDQLRRVMLDLNRAYGGPIFLPHVTLASMDKPINLEKSHPVVRLPVIDVVAGHSATQCIMMRLRETTSFNQLQSQFGEQSAPHMSLLYDHANRLPMHRRNDLSSHVHLPIPSIEFDRIGLVRGGPVVSEWEIIQSLPLNEA